MRHGRLSEIVRIGFVLVTLVDRVGRARYDDPLIEVCLTCTLEYPHHHHRRVRVIFQYRGLREDGVA